MVPVIDIAPLLQSSADAHSIANAINAACRKYGFFYIVGHGVSETIQESLERLSAHFFAQNEAEKMRIRMELGGRAWRGYFPVGGELTSGMPDLKEGLYFGTELGAHDPRVQAGLPMHGANLFPENLPEFKTAVLEYMKALTTLGHSLMRGTALSLGLKENFFAERYTSEPLCLFRIFHYPHYGEKSLEAFPWGVGEHTDYGLLTILKQDRVGGLQVKTPEGWIDAPYVEGSFICNIGDMLDRMTGGYYRSTPHRVRNTSTQGRFSYPFFFDPSFDAHIEAIELGHIVQQDDDQAQRWDGASVHLFEGSYGDYILNKVSKVFPQLKRSVEE